MRRSLLLAACAALLFSSGAASQATPICTMSATALKLGPSYKGTSWVSGVLKAFYKPSADSIGLTCTGFPTTVDSTAIKALQAQVAAYKDTVAQLRTTSTTPPPPPPDTTTPPPPSGGTMYFNSKEVGCGTDPHVLLCDDFEDGSWYEKNCDVANASGGLLQTDGWCGTIFADPTTPAKAAVCGGAGAKGTDCAASSGTLTGAVGGKNMADHNLSRPVKELWLRYYIWTSADHHFGAQKMITYNSTTAGSGGITIGGSGSPFNDGAYDTCPVYDCNIVGSVYYYRQNQGTKLTLSQIPGHWAYVELHIKLNTPGRADGLYDLWLNDCGVDGKACGAVPILRSHYTTVEWQASSENKSIVSLWFENWGNPGANGVEKYDQVYVTDSGPIGF